MAAEKRKRPAEEIENIVYQVFCWLRKWNLRDVTICTRERTFCFPSESDGAGPWTRGFRDLEDVWITPGGVWEEDWGDSFLFRIDDSVWEDTSLGSLLWKCKSYCIDGDKGFDALPADAQRIIRRLFEEQLEGPNRDAFKEKLFRDALLGFRWENFAMGRCDDYTGFYQAVTDHIVQEFGAIMEANRTYIARNHMDYWGNTMRVYADYRERMCL